jgi:serine/threonine-protein kinase
MSRVSGEEDDRIEPQPSLDAEVVTSDAFLRGVAHISERPPQRAHGRTAEHDDLVGRTLSHFRVVSMLGRGGMGVVYLARDEALHRDVALKVLPHAYMDDPDRRRRFVREARSAAAVTHPCVAAIFEVGEAEGRVFIAMEHVEGQSLRALLAAEQPSFERIVRIAQGVARGLAKAHDKGIVHRDLKPENVMVDRDDQVKILDFGLARAAASDDPAPTADATSTTTETQVTGGGLILGTPAYMSPEQIRGGLVDARSDVFSFGVVLYEMIAGARPFAGKNGSELLAAITEVVPSPLLSRRGDVPPELAAIVDRCLRKDPSERHASALDLCAELVRLGAAPPVEAPALTERGAGSMHSTEGLAGEPAPASSRRRRWAALGGLVAAMAILAVAFVFARRAGERTRSAAGEKGTVTLLDLPLPTSPKPEAITAYRRGLQSVVDADLDDALEAFKQAVSLDPGLAAAHLWLARLMFFESDLSRAKDEYRTAARLRTALDERDQAVLQAWEPSLGRDTFEDAGETITRLKLLSQRYPRDVDRALEVCHIGYPLPLEERLAACHRAVDLDPKCAAGWWLLGLELGRHDRLDEAKAALQHCVAITPSARACTRLLAQEASMRGDCAEVEALARSGGLFEERALALHALGRPEDIVAEVMKSAWNSEQEPFRAQAQEHSRGMMDVMAGRFSAAEDRFRKLARAVANERDALPHGFNMSLVALLVETGRDEEADAIAADYLEHAEVWTPMTLSMVVAADGTPFMLGTRLHAKKLTDAEWRTRAAAWRNKTQSVGSRQARRISWARAFAAPAETPAQAAIALAEPDAEFPPAPFQGHGWFGVDAEVGHAMLLAGRVDDARARFEIETKACFALNHPFTFVRAHLWLGQALEAKGDVSAACDAYRKVVARWGRATPPSVTASQALARIKALKCDAK